MHSLTNKWNGYVTAIRGSLCVWCAWPCGSCGGSLKHDVCDERKASAGGQPVSAATLGGHFRPHGGGGLGMGLSVNQVGIQGVCDHARNDGQQDALRGCPFLSLGVDHLGDGQG